MTPAQLLGALCVVIALALLANIGDSFINWRKRRGRRQP